MDDFVEKLADDLELDFEETLRENLQEEHEEASKTGKAFIRLVDRIW